MCSRDFNIAENLDRNYFGDQFVNIVKCYESSQPNINSAIKISAKFVETLNKKGRRKKFKGRFEEIVKKKKRESKLLRGQYIRRPYGLLVQKMHFFFCQDEN